ncbi:MAG: hypothetical protein HYT72_05835 [Candidatus Aenigmarchaeota archaeon]|nr:hypothetical protein [Candidatus Aenigmarchaeota archaeon]
MLEKMKYYFDRELLSVLTYSIIAVIAGYISFLVNQPKAALVVMAAFLAISTLFIRFALRIREKYNWYLKNGVMVFLFVWFIAWTLFYNLNIVI